MLAALRGTQRLSALQQIFPVLIKSENEWEEIFKQIWKLHEGRRFKEK